MHFLRRKQIDQKSKVEKPKNGPKKVERIVQILIVSGSCLEFGSCLELKTVGYSCAYRFGHMPGTATHLLTFRNLIFGLFLENREKSIFDNVQSRTQLTWRTHNVDSVTQC